jgi:hypothetical protein
MSRPRLPLPVRWLLLLLGFVLWPVRIGAQQPAILEAGGVQFAYWPATRALAAALAGSEARTTPLPGMPADILERGRPIVVYITPDEARFAERTEGRAPDWGAGVAFPDAGVIVLPGYGSARGGAPELHGVLRHELAHVALQRRLGEVRVPRWFTEGYAVWTARQLDADAAWLLRLAFVFNRAPSLDSLELRWPAASGDARVAYLLSATAVQYLYGLGSPATFTRFLDAWAEAGTFEQALRMSYLLSSAQFERLWRRQVRSSYGWLLFLTQGVVLALFFTASVLALFALRRRRDRRRLAALRATELPDDPAYWLEVNGTEPPAAPGSAHGDGPAPTPP